MITILNKYTFVKMVPVNPGLFLKITGTGIIITEKGPDRDLGRSLELIEADNNTEPARPVTELNKRIAIV